MVAEIKKSVLTQQIQDGWKRKALAEHYGLPETQMAQVLKTAGLQIRKFHTPKYQFVDDTEDVTENVEDTIESNDVIVGEDVNMMQEEGNTLQEEVQEVQEEVSQEKQEPTASW